MNKKLVLGTVILLTLSILWLFEAGTAEDSNQLGETVYGVATTNGTLTFENNTLIGGDPVSYITLTEGRIFLTTTGQQYYDSGTKIDCNPPPGYPNPCNQS